MSDLIYIRYSRKSSEAKERQIASIADQNKECEIVEYREGLNAPFKLEENKSAFKPNNRPEFDKMLALIESGQANAILTWKEDRLCRNPKEGGQLLQLLQDGKIKEIRTVTGAIYTPDSDHLVLQIHFGMANQYSRNLSQNVRRGLVHKCERGEYPRPAPIGYQSYGKIGQRLMRPHPYEAPLVLKAYQLASNGGMSLAQICRQMHEEGLRTKKGKKISKSHLHNILRSPTYYGYFLHNGELFEGNYEPIITKQLYDQVQEALQGRSKPKIRVWEHTYNGLITCGDCGCQITTTVKEKWYKRTNRTAIYTYHQCTHRRENCKQEAVTGKELEQLLIQNMTQISIDEEAWELGMDLFRAMHEEESGKLNKKLRYLQNHFTSVRDQIKELVKMRTRKELTQDEFMEQKGELLQEKKDVEEKIKDNDYSADNWLELCTKYLNNAFSAHETMTKGKPQEKRDLILDVGQNLILKDGKLDFKFKEPYDVLLIPKYRQSMLAGVDAIRTFWQTTSEQFYIPNYSS